MDENQTNLLLMKICRQRDLVLARKVICMEVVSVLFAVVVFVKSVLCLLNSDTCSVAFCLSVCH